MKETGKIVSADDKNCQVEFVRSSACESCGACNRMGGQSMCVTLPNTMGVHIGDTVVVEMSARNVIGASAWAYIFPLFMLVLGAYVGKLVMDLFSFNGDWIVAVCSLVFAGIAYIILMMLNPYFAKKRGLRPVMVGVYRAETKTEN